MNTFLPVTPQQPGQISTPDISISKKSSSTRLEFEKYKQNLLTNPGQSLYDYCHINGVSYNALRGYASNNHINIRALRRASFSISENTSANPEKEQQIHVVVNVRNTSFDISGISFEQLSEMIERMVDHV